MRALVTGGAGFIGYHVADRLKQGGWEVLVLDSLDRRVHGPGPPQLPEGVEWLRGDLRSPTVRARALSRGIDVIFHEAALCGLGRGVEDVRDFLEANVLSTLDLLRDASTASHAPRRVVLASSMAIYGEGAYRCPRCQESRTGRRSSSDLSEGRWEPRCSRCSAPLRPEAVVEEHPPAPATMYARSKEMQEGLALEMARARSLPLVALRYHNVYGPNMPRDTPYAAVASIFRSALARGEAPQVLEDGLQLRDFVHVQDVAEANLLAAEAPEEKVAYEAFNIGTGRPRTILDLARLLTHELAPEREPELPGTFRHGDARHVFASVAKAQALLGFEARIGWEEGMLRFAHDPLRERPAALEAVA
ncbi:MAG: NAD-dependent epimerase/dehydratase family protein [Euryarchaeota archaeon]|nr:NAD-dependent epimerase/dehydratase family protein [Euryarchaeota archaeon]MDE1835647.1 NAD-dependent epimerase/dehydratase family protein [Euryarchaeota archaeon]MDE1878995.1 NAD-dependent epimerase/dehydratase family protein [Euryarchaeota archaeon]MDE2043731.1 NAD-dependent epimerase/dehydratase family protein [Thermoplasmata archaeon]